MFSAFLWGWGQALFFDSRSDTLTLLSQTILPPFWKNAWGRCLCPGLGWLISWDGASGVPHFSQIQSYAVWCCSKIRPERACNPAGLQLESRSRQWWRKLWFNEFRIKHLDFLILPGGGDLILNSVRNTHTLILASHKDAAGPVKISAGDKCTLSRWQQTNVFLNFKNLLKRPWGRTSCF